jgi:hypothetical protein
VTQRSVVCRSSRAASLPLMAARNKLLVGAMFDDWQNEIYRTAIEHHNIVLSGGTDNIVYRAPCWLR